MKFDLETWKNVGFGTVMLDRIQKVGVTKMRKVILRRIDVMFELRMDIRPNHEIKEMQLWILNDGAIMNIKNSDNWEKFPEALKDICDKALERTKNGQTQPTLVNFFDDLRPGEEKRELKSVEDMLEISGRTGFNTWISKDLENFVACDLCPIISQEPNPLALYPRGFIVMFIEGVLKNSLFARGTIKEMNFEGRVDLEIEMDSQSRFPPVRGTFSQRIDGGNGIEVKLDTGGVALIFGANVPPTTKKAN